MPLRLKLKLGYMLYEANDYMVKAEKDRSKPSGPRILGLDARLDDYDQTLR